MARRGLLAAMVLAACGGSGGGGAPAAPAGPPDLTARPAGPDDLVVARVDGRPVYASCVAAQARGRHVDRATALADCVDLELLAGAAMARGLDRDPAVAAAGREAAATRLIDREFSGRYRTWNDLPAGYRDPLLAKNRDRMVRPESRASWLGRVKVSKAEAGTARDQLAERAIRAAWDQPHDRAHLFSTDLDRAVHAAAAAVDPTLQVEVAAAPPTARDFGAQKDYREALFTIGAIGMISAPTRTPWGWDLILFTDFRAPPPMTEADLVAKLFPAARRALWTRWSTELAVAHAAKVADDAALRRALGDRGGGS